MRNNLLEEWKGGSRAQKGKAKFKGACKEIQTRWARKKKKMVDFALGSAAKRAILVERSRVRTCRTIGRSSSRY